MLLISASNHVRLFFIICIENTFLSLYYHTTLSQVASYITVRPADDETNYSKFRLFNFLYFYIFQFGNEIFNTNTVVDTALVALKLQFYFISFYFKFTSPE